MRITRTMVINRPASNSHQTNTTPVVPPMNPALTKLNNKSEKKYCLFYNRFGRCSRGDSCTYIHDPKRVALCPRFLSFELFHSPVSIAWDILFLMIIIKPNTYLLIWLKISEGYLSGRKVSVLAQHESRENTGVFVFCSRLLQSRKVPIHSRLLRQRRRVLCRVRQRFLSSRVESIYMFYFS